MSSNTDNRVQAFKEGISEIAMEDIVFSILCGFEPVDNSLLAGTSTSAFPMVKFDSNRSYNSIKVIDLFKSHINFQKDIDHEMIESLFTMYARKTVTVRSMPVKAKSAIFIEDEEVKKAIIDARDALYKKFSIDPIRHYIYTTSITSRTFHGSENVLKSTETFTLADLVEHGYHYKDNTLFGDTGTENKMTLAYMRKRNMTMIDIFKKYNPQVTVLHSENDETVEQKVNYIDMIDNKLWLLQDEFIKNEDSIQSAVIGYYKKRLHQSQVEQSGSVEDSADSIMADMVERNSRAPSNAK